MGVNKAFININQIMKRTALCSAILLFSTLATAKTGCEEYAYEGVFPTTTAKVQVLCKNGFAIGYSPQKKTLLWVVERIDPNTNYQIDKRSSFHKDPAVPSNKQASMQDYAGTGYHKGHMVSFEDMSFHPDAAYDSMSFTNVVPQNPTNNTGAWKSLELTARKSAKLNSIYVVSGVFFEGKIDYIGDGVPIPTKLFKTIIDPKKQTAKTFILPNTPVVSSELRDYMTTVDAVKMLGTDPTPNAKLKDVK